jgi:hypothetical protein
MRKKIGPRVLRDMNPREMVLQGTVALVTVNYRLLSSEEAHIKKITANISQ